MVLLKGAGEQSAPLSGPPPIETTGAPMKVKMLVQLTGTRDGVAWPAPGGTVELPDHEAARLCAAGTAEPVNTRSKDVEKAVPPAAETRAPAKKRASRRKSGS